MASSTSYIHGWSFEGNAGHLLSDSAFLTVISGSAGLRAVANPAALAPGQPPLKYSLSDELFVRTSLFTPGALRGWGFIQLFGETDTVDGVELTFQDVRVWDGTEALYWDGANWVTAGATDFNTLADLNLNLAAFTGASLAIEVRLRTIDGGYTPTISGVCMQWTGERISFLREWVVETLLRSMKEAIRPLSRFPLDHLGGDIIAMSDHPLDATWSFSSIDAVYDHTNDPSHLVDILSSYDSAERLVTLNASVPVGTRLWLVARYAPQVAITTSSDYFEGGKSPAILITMVTPQWGGRSLGARGPSVIDVTKTVPSGTVYPSPIPLIDIDIALATVAPTSHDLIALNEAVGSWLDAHPTLRSRALDQAVKMTPGNVLDWNTAQDDVKDPRIAAGTLSLLKVPVIGDAGAGAADGSATKVIGAVDAGDPAAPGVGYAIGTVNVVTTNVSTGGTSTFQIAEE